MIQPRAFFLTVLVLDCFNTRSFCSDYVDSHCMPMLNYMVYSKSSNNVIMVNTCPPACTQGQVPDEKLNNDHIILHKEVYEKNK